MYYFIETFDRVLYYDYSLTNWLHFGGDRRIDQKWISKRMMAFRTTSDSKAKASSVSVYTIYDYTTLAESDKWGEGMRPNGALPC